MDFTAGQYAVMEKLDKGLHFDALPESEKEIVNYLSRQNIVQPRAQIADDYMELSQKGKQILHAHYAELQARYEKAKKEAEDHAEQKRQQAFENKMSVLNFVAPLVTFVLGILVEHFASIVDFLVDIFS